MQNFCFPKVMSFANRRERLFMVLWTGFLSFGFETHLGKWWPVIFEKYIFEVWHPLQEYTKMRVPDKSYRTKTVRTFWDPRRTSALRKLGLDHFSRFGTKICEIEVRLSNICSQHRVFPLPWWYFSVQMKIFRQSGKVVVHYEEKW